MRYLYLCLILIGSFGCNRFNKPTDSEDTLLASVFDRNLHMSELEDLIPSGSTAVDSQQFIKSYITRWIKSALMMEEAEKNIPADLELDKLVNMYRESLILHNYEKLLVEKNIDTTVNEQLLLDHYQENKDDYQLKYTIIRSVYVKLKAKDSAVKKLAKALKASKLDWSNLQQLIKFSEPETRLDTSSWVKALEVIESTPGNQITIRNLSKGKLYEIEKDGFKHFLKVLEVARADGTAPYSFVRDQILKLVQHQQKSKLLEKLRDDLYNREISRQNIKIYY